MRAGVWLVAVRVESGRRRASARAQKESVHSVLLLLLLLLPMRRGR